MHHAGLVLLYFNPTIHQSHFPSVFLIFSSHKHLFLMFDILALLDFFTKSQPQNHPILGTNEVRVLCEIDEASYYHLNITTEQLIGFQSS